MRIVNLTIDGQELRESAPLGTTLQAFLEGLKVPVPSLFVDTHGRRVSPRHTLVHSVCAARLTSLSEVPAEVAALTLEELATRA